MSAPGIGARRTNRQKRVLARATNEWENPMRALHKKICLIIIGVIIFIFILINLGIFIERPLSGLSEDTVFEVTVSDSYDMNGPYTLSNDEMLSAVQILNSLDGRRFGAEDGVRNLSGSEVIFRVERQNDSEVVIRIAGSFFAVNDTWYEEDRGGNTQSLFDIYYEKYSASA